VSSMVDYVFLAGQDLVAIGYFYLWKDGLDGNSKIKHAFE
jgi:hypothetical protein